MQEKKILWFWKNSAANVLLGGLIVAFVVGLIWSYVMAQDFSDNAWVEIIEVLLGAVVVGALVGSFTDGSKRSTPWLIAGFAWLSYMFTVALMNGSSEKIGDAIVGSMQAEALSIASVSIGAVVIAIVAIASSSLGSKMKM